MLRVPVHKIQPGMILARPIHVPNDPRRFLLQRDREVPVDMIPRLQKLGICDVWIRHRDLEFLENIIDEGLGDRQREVYQHVRQNFESIMGDAAVELDMSHFQSSISDLFDFLKQSSCGNMLLQKLDTFDNYLMSHSTNVCYLALLLGMKLERYLIEERCFKNAREAKDLQLLGLGCLLHDVGKMRIPPELLNSPARLTAEQIQIMRLASGVRARDGQGTRSTGRGSSGAESSSAVCRRRLSGPHRQPHRRTAAAAGRQAIPVFSRIATVVDVYDAATSTCVYQSAKYPVQVLH